MQSGTPDSYSCSKSLGFERPPPSLWRVCKFASRNGRAGEIRTHDLLHPMQARYQATLQPEPENGQKDSRHSARQGLFCPNRARSKATLQFIAAELIWSAATG